ncbi:MAG TPA: Ig-like domain-containing protein [Gemmatimonadaceae bacterium]|nr:Ig-like domain-containing protein [Gemmatimonadaceae bacterium]
MRPIGVRRCRLVALAVGAVMLISCSGDGNSTMQGPPTVASVTIAAPSASIAVGETERLSATAKDAQGNVVNGTGLTWSSSNTSIATVNDSGVATGVAPGAVSITATAGTVPGSLSLTITSAPVSSVVISPDQVGTLTVGDTVRLAATEQDAGGGALDGAVTWSSLDTMVARVDSGGLVTAWGAGSTFIHAASGSVSDSVQVTDTAATPALLTLAAIIGKDSLPAGDTPQGGQGAPIDSIGCLGMSDTVAYHIHIHLTLIVNGEQLAVPLGIGTVDRTVSKEFGEGLFVTAASCFYWIHTHDESGVLHVEAPIQRGLTLGNAFDVWGQPLTRTNVAGFKGPVTVFVDGKLYTGDPRDIAFVTHKEITLEIGGPLVPPPVYAWPSGLP